MQINTGHKRAKSMSYKKWGAPLLILLIVLLLFLTSEKALRTYIFMTGYLDIAIKTELTEVPFELATAAMLKPNEILYELPKPPIEKATEGELRY